MPDFKITTLFFYPEKGNSNTCFMGWLGECIEKIYTRYPGELPVPNTQKFFVPAAKSDLSLINHNTENIAWSWASVASAFSL